MNIKKNPKKYIIVQTTVKLYKKIVKVSFWVNFNIYTRIKHTRIGYDTIPNTVKRYKLRERSVFFIKLLLYIFV